MAVKVRERNGTRCGVVVVAVELESAEEASAEEGGADAVEGEEEGEDPMMGIVTDASAELEVVASTDAEAEEEGPPKIPPTPESLVSPLKVGARSEDGERTQLTEDPSITRARARTRTRTRRRRRRRRRRSIRRGRRA